jgi:Conjugative transposon protein TcpC
MARRATLDRGMPRDADDDDAGAGDGTARFGRGGRRSAPERPEPQQLAAQRSAARRSGSVPWRGAGGRWVIWTLRIIAWVVLLVIGYRGVLAIVQGSTSTGSGAAPAPAAAPASKFPATQAEAYALQFGSAYLNFSPATAASRAGLLAAMLPAGTDPQLGWNGVGTQTLQAENVAGIAVQGPHKAIVTLLAEINGSQAIELGVPVYASGGRFVVTGEPALLPVPKAAAAPTAPAQGVDSTAVTALQTQLPAFFRAYASGSQATLSRFLVQGAQVTGLGGAVAYNQLVSVTAPPGGSTRKITAVVSWTVPTSTETTTSGTRKHPATNVSTASLEMTYNMTVVEQGGTWYVQSIGSSAQSPGPP